MAKQIQEEMSDLAAAEIAELDMIAENSLPNKHELVSIKNQKDGNTSTIQRLQVYKYAAVMATNFQIATLVGISKESLQKFFPKELKMGRAFARQKLLTRFYNLALFGNNPADRLFALKNWAGMSDTGMNEEFDDVEEGLDFKVRRPQKQIERTFELDAKDATVIYKEAVPELDADEEA